MEPESFVATSAAVFNGAGVGAGSVARVNCVVHLNSRLEPGSVVPIGWVAVGDPAEILPPGDRDGIWAIQNELDFPGTVSDSDRATPRGERTRRYARALRRQNEDRRVDAQA